MSEIFDRTVVEMWADAWRQESAYSLAKTADCAAPDNNESAGAILLYSVRDNLLEAFDYSMGDEPVEINEPEDTVTEIADAAPDVYTHQRWQEFVDLAAYQEECELGEWPNDLTDAAGIALYQIAYRLAAAMLEDLRDRTS